MQIEDAKRLRRKRRTRTEVTDYIRDAAQTLFAERGYAATTTKEIARVADVSETLLFRYFGDKATLYDEMISAPFNQLLEAFVARRALTTGSASREADLRRLVGQLFELFDRNRALFGALLAAPSAGNVEASPNSVKGLERYFQQAAEQVRLSFEAEGQAAPFDIHIAVRLGFGMVASGVLLRDWLFPTGAPGRDQVSTVLEEMITRSLAPRANG